MPRKPRLIVPGGLFHVIARGNERRKIFLDNQDYLEFIERLAIALDKSHCRCLAWALMPNHFHLLIQSGAQGTAPLMRRLMTGYVGYFNRRYRRSGHLFQNRYKSILCDQDTYLLELVRYIHLNPVRSKLVKTVEELKTYPWTGHGTLVGYKPKKFQTTEGVLRQFSSQESEAQKRYVDFVKDGVNQGRREDLMGGGFLRSLGREPGDWEGIKKDDRTAHDDRILGSGHFVESVLNEVEKGTEQPLKLSVSEIAERIAKHLGVDPADLMHKGRWEPVSQAKAILIYIGTRYRGETAKKMGNITGMSAQAASKAKGRGSSLWESDPSLRKLIS